VTDTPDKRSPLRWELRIAPRARHAKLRIRPYGGLEVVIPPRFPRAQIPALVERHAAWARRQLDRQTRLRDAIRLPQRLDLAYDGSSTPVIYTSEPLCWTGDLFAEPSSAPIVVEAADQASRIGELRGWIRRRAQQLLPPKLEELSRRSGLDFARVGIRSQKTRWGSCSSRGHISLNDQLLFLPEDTVEYLMIHELCHTRQLDHSRRFWRLVETHCPDYRAHERLMSRSRDRVPDWFLVDLYR